MKKNTKREGFTLVELLIVIVVIGVLSAMMMLSSTEAVSSAKAADIVSDLRNLKTAALAYYADHLDETEKTGNGGFAGLQNADVQKAIKKYMNNEGIGDYKFSGKLAGSWCVWLAVSDTKVQDKLYSRKDSVGLRGIATLSDTSSGDVYNKQAYVGMFIR